MRRRAQSGMGGRTKGDAKEEEANILFDALLHIVLCVPLPLPLSRWQPNMIGSHLRNSPFLHRHAVCSPPITNFSPKFTEPLNRRCMQQPRTTVVDLRLFPIISWAFRAQSITLQFAKSFSPEKACLFLKQITANMSGKKQCERMKMTEQETLRLRA